MSDTSTPEAPDPPEVLEAKLKSMLYEHVRVQRQDDDSAIRGILTPKDNYAWEVEGRNGSYARFSLKNVRSICPRLITIYITPLKEKDNAHN